MSLLYQDRFKDKVILVTGGTTGIGKATALRAAQEGAKVVIVGRNAEKGNEVIKEIESKNGTATFLQYDLTDEMAAKEIVDKTIDVYNRLDIAVNNVGIMGNPAPVHMLTKEEMDRVFNTNFYSCVYACRYEIIQFLKQNEGGVIINNASVAGITGVPGLPAYNASKHAVNGLTKTLAIDYAPYHIRVNSVNPASTDTPLTQSAKELIIKQMKDGKEMPSIVSQKNSNLQMKAATSEQQAASILFLASDDASHMTGEIVQTDGGWTAF